jgi:antitoxin YefM
MKAISYTAARQNLAKTMENVCRDHAPIIPQPMVRYAYLD